jgi:hypothetical protein
LAYAHKINSKLSASLSSRIIFSNIATGIYINGIRINTANTFAFDFGLSYITNAKLAGYSGKMVYGLSITNLGKGISYIKTNEDLILMPANINLGTALELNMGNANKLSISLDLDKLLVPTPTRDDLDLNGKPDHLDKTYFEGLIGSFSDAKGGLSEELSEISGSIVDSHLEPDTITNIDSKEIINFTLLASD